MQDKKIDRKLDKKNKASIELSWNEEKVAQSDQTSLPRNAQSCLEWRNHIVKRSQDSKAGIRNNQT